MFVFLLKIVDSVTSCVKVSCSIFSTKVGTFRALRVLSFDLKIEGFRLFCERVNVWLFPPLMLFSWFLQLVLWCT